MQYSLKQNDWQSDDEHFSRLFGESAGFHSDFLSLDIEAERESDKKHLSSTHSVNVIPLLREAP